MHTRTQGGRGELGHRHSLGVPSPGSVLRGLRGTGRQQASVLLSIYYILDTFFFFLVQKSVVYFTFKSCGKCMSHEMCHCNHFLGVRFSGTECTHSVGQLSLPAVSRTPFILQN